MQRSVIVQYTLGTFDVFMAGMACGLNLVENGFTGFLSKPSYPSLPSPHVRVVAFVHFRDRWDLVGLAKSRVAPYFFHDIVSYVQWSSRVSLSRLVPPNAWLEWTLCQYSLPSRACLCRHPAGSPLPAPALLLARFHWALRIGVLRVSDTFANRKAKRTSLSESSCLSTVDR